MGQGGHYGRGDHLESAEENISQFWEREDDDGRCDIDLRIALLFTVLCIPLINSQLQRKYFISDFQYSILSDAF